MSRVPKHLKGWQFIIISATVIAVATGGFFLYNLFWGSKPSTADTGQLIAVNYGNISKTLTISGSLAYYNTTQVTFGTGGTVQTVRVAEGDRVNKGQVLAELDAASNLTLQRAVLSAQQALSTAQTNLDQAQRPYTDIQIFQAQMAVTSAEIALNTANESLYKAQHPYTDADIVNAQAAVTSAIIAVTTANDNLYKAQNPYTDADIITLQAAVTSARIALNAAQDNLYKAQHPYTDADIVNAQAAVTSARIALNTSQDNLYKVQHPYTDAQISRAQEDVTTAQHDLSNTIRKWENDIIIAQFTLIEADTAYQNALITYGELSSNTTKAWNSLEAAQINLTILWANYAKALPPAQDKVTQALDVLAAMTAPPDPLIVQQKQEQLQIAQSNLAKAQDNLAKAQAGPDPLDVQQKQQQLSIIQSNLAKAQDNLAKAQAGPDPLDVLQRQQQLAIAQFNLAKAQDNLAKAQAGPDPLDVQQKQQQLSIAQSNLANVKQTLADMQKAPDVTAIKLLQIQVETAQIALSSAQSQSQLVVLTAPSAGTVTSVGIRSGQTVSAAAAAVEISTPSVFGLTALVNQLDIPQLRIDQPAIIRTDALSGVSLSGRVISINSTPVTQQGVVSYRVTVEVPTPPGVQLKVGMTAIASVIVQQANNVLLVPNKAVGGTLSNPTVVVMADNQTQTRSVKTGMVDSNYTQIIDGLQEGDLVVVNSAAKATSAKTINPTSNTTSTTNSTLIPTIPANEPIPTRPAGGVTPGGGAPGGGFQQRIPSSGQR